MVRGATSTPLPRNFSSYSKVANGQSSDVATQPMVRPQSFTVAVVALNPPYPTSIQCV